jgi:hypothetical protein
MKCPTCGGEKKHHTDYQWKIHKQMHESHMKQQRELKRYVSIYKRTQ